MRWKQTEVLFCSITYHPPPHPHPDNIRKSFFLFGGSHGPPSSPSDKNSIKMKMTTEHWWNVTDISKLKHSEGNLPISNLSTSSLTCTFLGLNPGLRNKRSTKLPPDIHRELEATLYITLRSYLTENRLRLR